MVFNRLTEGLPPAHRRSLNACWKEGVAAQFTISLLDQYLIPFALFIGAGAGQVGLLVAVPNLLAAMIQPWAVHAVQWAGNRRRALLIGVMVQSLCLAPAAALAFWKSDLAVAGLVAAAVVYRLTSSLIGPIWGSLVSHYLPDDRRGVYFGWRSRAIGLAGLSAVVAWGLILSAAKERFEAAAFAGLFAFAAAARFVSWFYMRQMSEVPVPAVEDADFTFWMFLRRIRESNFVRFVLYVTGITFATQLAAPYFAVHMLQGLGFGYGTFMMIQFGSAVSGLVCFPLWGRHADRVGNARVLKTTSLLIPLIPLLWIFARTPGALFCVELFSGFVWGGFNLAVTNFMYDAVTPAKRVRCLAYHNMITGTAVLAGASLGGWLAGRLPALSGSSLYALFLLSAAVRFAAHFLLSGGFREVRSSTEPISRMDLFFSVLGLRPMAGRNIEPAVFPDVKTPAGLPGGKEFPSAN